MDLKISVSSSDPYLAAADVLVVGIPSGADHAEAIAALRQAIGDKALNQAVSRTLQRSEFSGKKGQLCDVPVGAALKASRLALVGVGDVASFTDADARRLGARAARYARGHHASSLAVAGPSSAEGIEGAIAQGIVLGGYRFERFKTGDRVSKYPLERATVITRAARADAAIKRSVSEGQRIAEAVCIARDLINTPPNELYPEALAGAAKKIASERRADGLSCTVLTYAQIKKRGMNLIDAVGRGSSRPPCLVHIVYRPPGAARGAKLPKLAFVGKGMTFDTGGICIKPAPGMEEMKGDMGGAANVVALMAALAVTRPKAEIHGIIACAENMPDGSSYRPGDIFTSYQGKTVEIINTDAEGRLVLADALHYAAELKPDFILDNATLTGACVVALGPTVSGFYSNRGGLAERMSSAAKAAGEAMWHMPLVEDLRDMLKSEWADLKHVGDRWGGSITAALFLREFIGEIPWIHVDVAGPSMANKAYDVFAKGGTGHGVLTYLELIDDLIRNGVPKKADAS